MGGEPAGTTGSVSTSPGMGYQPALDGLRALSVALVVFYHAGVVAHSAIPYGVSKPWFFDGGFLGVEVFFVVSGYLITTLLLEERARTGTVSLREFWARRFRRLMPALWVMIAVTAVWSMIWGRAYLDDLRKDIPFGITYTSNFQQLFRKVSYFEGLPHLLRHLWSLAVEEHFYLLFPPLLLLMLRRRTRPNRHLLWLVVPAALASVITLIAVWQRPYEKLTDTGAQLDDLRQNWAYLSTVTRVGGILIGVALAVIWSPWARRNAPLRRSRALVLDVAGVLSIAGIVVMSLLVGNEDAFLYRGGLTLVSLLSAVAIAVAVHPNARAMRGLFGNPVMAAIGRRSYGLYLWHWPVFVGPFEGRSLLVRLLVGIPVMGALSEICYRFIETPIRKGGVMARVRRRPVTLLGSFSVVTAAIVVGLVMVRTPQIGGLDDAEVASALETDDPALDDELLPDDAMPLDSLPTDPPPVDSSSAGSLPVDTAPDDSPSTSAPAPTTTLPLLPRRVVAVGDSTAGAFARNVPKNIRKTFRFYDGQLSGCSVNNAGVAVGELNTGRDFRVCRGWQGRWSGNAKRYAAEIVLVIIGAWDVFDLKFKDRTVQFGSAEWDASWVANLRTGIDAVVETGAQVALLEVPCYRPYFTGGPGTRVFPERRDDSRTRHLNDLLRSVADSDPGNVTFIAGPTEWCTDETIATSRSNRYDGVHYTGRGALLVYQAIRDQLLAIPVSPEQHAKRPRN